MSMARYISMVVESSVWACSCWPIVAYSRPRPRWQWAWSWAHPQLLSQGLAVVGDGGLDLGRLAPHRALAEEADGVSLVAAFLVRAGEGQRALSEGVRLLQTACPHMGLSQWEETERLQVNAVPGTRLV